jgi:glycerol uptake facilitator-like aquaporin
LLTSLGAVFNPAITTSLLLLGEISPVKAVLYILAQMGGATLASLLHAWIFPIGEYFRCLLQISIFHLLLETRFNSDFA